MKPQGDTSITNTRRTKFKVTRKTVEDPGEPPPLPPTLFLELNEARRAQKYFFETGPLPLISGSGWPTPPPLPYLMV